MDYGATESDIFNSLFALSTNNNTVIRRSERMLSAGLQIKVWYYKVSDEKFER